MESITLVDLVLGNLEIRAHEEFLQFLISRDR